MKRLVSGLFSSISDAELLMATMGNDEEGKELPSGEQQSFEAVQPPDGEKTE